MNQQLLCQPHSEFVKYLGRDFQSKELIGFCSKCVPTAQMPLILIEDAERDIEQNKYSLLKLIEEEKDENITILTKLLQFLNQFKNDQVQKLDQLILNIKQEINFIQKSCASKSEVIKGLNTLDINQLVNVFQQKDNQQKLQKKKEQILVQLSDIQSKTFLFESSNTLQSFPSQKQFQLNKQSNSSSQSQVLKCKKHNQNIVAIDLSEQNFNGKLLCLSCISEKPRQVMTINDANKLWNDHHSYLQQAYIQYQQQLQQTVSVLQNHISKYLGELKIKLEQTSIMLEKLQQTKTKFIQKQISLMRNAQFNQDSQADLIKIIEISKKSNKIQIQEETKEMLNLLLAAQSSKTQNIDLKKLFQISISVQNLLLGNENEYALQKQSKYLIQYKNIPKSLTKQEGTCYAITINTDGNFLAAGCDNKINIYQFNLGKVKLLQQLDQDGEVYCLQFMKYQSCFVSGGEDRQIKIWIYLQGSWSLNQILLGHSNLISCLAINSKGDQVISGSYDKSIKIWKLEIKIWSNSQTILNHKNSVQGLSLNESEDQMISCDNDGLILVMKQSDQWWIAQQIQQKCGYRLCFITHNLFSFQQKDSQNLLIFECYSNKLQYIQTKVVQMNDDNKYQYCNSLFPQQFIKSKQILVNKFKNYLNIVKRLDNGEFKVDQSIQMNSNKFYGTISNDGEYLFISESNEIKVYKYGQKK